MGPGRADRLADQLRGLCAEAVKMLPAFGAGMSVVAKNRQFSLLAAADPVSEHLEELQFVLGEGPCVDAAASRRPVLVADLAEDGPSRWPMYSAAARETGVRAIFAFPLQVGAAQLGVLDLFRIEPGPLSTLELARAFAVADRALVTRRPATSGIRPPRPSRRRWSCSRRRAW
jgi:transcriptional regulator with GAF, ATPase, and Fis domain